MPSTKISLTTPALPTCAICLDDGAQMTCEGNKHYFHHACFEQFVESSASAMKERSALLLDADVAGGEALLKLEGRICCPCVSCESHWSDAAVAKSVSDEIFELYLESRTKLKTARQLRESLESMRAVETPSECSADDAIDSVLLKASFEDARMCGRCLYGPVDLRGCEDLTSHHGERSGDGRVDNSCPRCHWFAADWGSWPRWDGRTPSQSAALRVSEAVETWRSLPRVIFRVESDDESEYSDDEPEPPPPPRAPAYEVPWADLTHAERTAATLLGYDEVLWDAGCNIIRARWAQLTEQDLDAATTLGFNSTNWDAALDEVEQRAEMLCAVQWADLTHAERTAATLLGFDEAIWDPEEWQWPEHLVRTRWAQLTALQAHAATALGYDSTAWDADIDEIEQEEAEQEEADADELLNAKLEDLVVTHRLWVETRRAERSDRRQAKYACATCEPLDGALTPSSCAKKARAGGSVPRRFGSQRPWRAKEPHRGARKLQALRGHT